MQLVVQAVIFTYWAEGGPICKKKAVGGIVLPEDSHTRLDEAIEAHGHLAHASTNTEHWERVDSDHGK